MLSKIAFLILTAALADAGALTEGQFAQTRFRFTRPSTVRMNVQTCNSQGQVKAIQMRVLDGTLNLNSLDLVYKNGAKERLSGSFQLRKGQASPWLSLANQADPCLSQILVNVGPSTGNQMTTVQFVGQWEK